MIPAISTPMTFEEFLAWDDGTGRDFELSDGIPMPINDPNAKHEDVADALCDILSDHCKQLNLPYVPKRSKQVRLKAEPGKQESSRRPDIVVFAQAEWQRLREVSSPAAAYVVPPMVVEVVSSNWKDDYLTKLGQYEDLGILEYWIVDYAGLGGVRYIGSPKQPTITVYQLHGNEYQPGKFFRIGELIESAIFPELQLTAAQVFAFG
jgi:Uma2 family endonuclease